MSNSRSSSNTFTVVPFISSNFFFIWTSGFDYFFAVVVSIEFETKQLNEHTAVHHTHADNMHNAVTVRFICMQYAAVYQMQSGRRKRYGKKRFPPRQKTTNNSWKMKSKSERIVFVNGKRPSRKQKMRWKKKKSTCNKCLFYLYFIGVLLASSNAFKWESKRVPSIDFP